MFVGVGANDVEEMMLQTKGTNKLVGIGADDFGSEGEEEFAWSMAAVTKKQYGGKHSDSRANAVVEDNAKKIINTDSATKSDLEYIDDSMTTKYNEDNKTTHYIASMLQTKGTNKLVGIGADDFGSEGEEEFAWSMAAVTK